MATTLLITSGTTFTIPADFGSSVNVDALGAGDNGNNGSWLINHSVGGDGGGGGAFARLLTLSGVTPGQVVSVHIGGAGGVKGTSASPGGGDTWFLAATSLYAQGIGGSAAACVPTAGATSGGAGGHGGSGAPSGTNAGPGGGGGGGAGGPDAAGGAGNNATTSGVPASGIGGTAGSGDGGGGYANSGNGGAGGNGGTNALNNGFAGTAGVLYGGGGGGGGGPQTSSDTPGSGAAGKNGLIVFVYNVAVPAITSITPAFGGTSGGTPVTITGSQFNGVTSVSFGGTAATSFTVNSPTSITATSPAHAAGSVSVTVTSPGGSDNTPFVFGAPASFGVVIG